MIRTALIAATRFLVGGQGYWIGSAPTSRQRIYFANHGSHLDTVLLWAALPPRLRDVTHPVAAADYWGRGRLRRRIALSELNAVLVERKPARGTEGGPLGPLKKVLAAGESLILFPEGTRSAERLPGPFKPGLWHLASEFRHVELIPVYLDNLRRAFPKGAYLPVPLLCAARFGPPIAIDPSEDKAAFLERARAAVVALA